VVEVGVTTEDAVQDQPCPVLDLGQPFRRGVAHDGPKVSHMSNEHRPVIGGPTNLNRIDATTESHVVVERLHSIGERRHTRYVRFWCMRGKLWHEQVNVNRDQFLESFVDNVQWQVGNITCRDTDFDLFRRLRKDGSVGIRRSVYQTCDLGEHHVPKVMWCNGNLLVQTVGVAQCVQETAFDCGILGKVTSTDECDWFG